MLLPRASLGCGWHGGGSFVNIPVDSPCDSLFYRLPQFKEEPKNYVGTNMKKV